MLSIAGAHQQALLLERRCGSCAEPLTPRELWGHAPCRWCRQPLFTAGSLDTGAVLAGVLGSWGRWRWPVYGLVGASCLLASLVPLLGPLVYAMAMLLANFFLIRRPLRWLAPVRRITTRLTLQIMLASLTVVNLVLSVAVYPFVGLAQLFSAILSVGLAVAYVEGALWLTSRALRREAAREPLRVVEWLPPALVLGFMVAFAAALVAFTWGAEWLFLQTDLPGVSTIVDWLTGESS